MMLMLCMHAMHLIIKWKTKHAIIPFFLHPGVEHAYLIIGSGTNYFYANSYLVLNCKMTAKYLFACTAKKLCE